MSDQERQTFESAFIADETAFDQVRAVEDEIVEQYVRGTLPASDRELFAAHYLVSAANRERVDLTRSMIGKFAADRAVNDLANEERGSFWSSILAFFAGNRLAFGSAFLVLALIAAGWFALSRKPAIDVAHNAAPTPESKPTIQTPIEIPQISSGNDNGTVSESNRPTPTPLPRNDNKPPEKLPESPRASTPVLALFAGSVRGGGGMPQLDLPKTANGARLQLNLESSDYERYSAQVADPDGRIVASSSNIKPTGKRVEVFVPTARLKNGEYTVQLSGMNKNNTRESVADFAFRVIQR
ncbi:MAG: hypothetical protein QM785_02620 [Pyrinomonadaceae bacterium]